MVNDIKLVNATELDNRLVDLAKKIRALPPVDSYNKLSFPTGMLDALDKAKLGYHNSYILEIDVIGESPRNFPDIDENPRRAFVSTVIDLPWHKYLPLNQIAFELIITETDEYIYEYRHEGYTRLLSDNLRKTEGIAYYLEKTYGIVSDELGYDKLINLTFPPKQIDWGDPLGDYPMSTIKTTKNGLWASELTKDADGQIADSRLIDTHIPTFWDDNSQYNDKGVAWSHLTVFTVTITVKDIVDGHELCVVKETHDYRNYNGNRPACIQIEWLTETY